MSDFFSPLENRSKRILDFLSSFLGMFPFALGTFSMNDVFTNEMIVWKEKTKEKLILVSELSYLWYKSLKKFDLHLNPYKKRKKVFFCEIRIV